MVRKFLLVLFSVLFFINFVYASNVVDVNITNVNSYDLIDYQVKLNITESDVSDSFNWDNLGSDFKFVDVNNNNLSFWIEDFNKTLKTSTVWIKVPKIEANSSIFIKFKYNQGNLNLQNGDDTFIFFDDFTEDQSIPYLGVGLQNADTNLNIPTYDGSGQTVHPSLVYFEDSFGGWKYWMVITPYADSNNQLENPSIVVSNDGNMWVEPDGITNPVDFATGNSFNSDPALIYDGNKFLLYYRVVNNNLYDEIKLKTSDNGIDWRRRTKFDNKYRKEYTICFSNCFIKR
jgi:hypothetical protein